MPTEDEIRAEVRAELARENAEQRLAAARQASQQRRAAAAIVAQDVADGREELRLRFQSQGWPADLADDLQDNEVLRATNRPVPEPVSTSAPSIAPKKHSATSGSFVSDPKDPEANSLEANLARIDADDAARRKEGDF